MKNYVKLTPIFNYLKKKLSTFDCDLITIYILIGMILAFITLYFIKSNCGIEGNNICGFEGIIALLFIGACIGSFWTLYFLMPVMTLMDKYFPEVETLRDLIKKIKKDQLNKQKDTDK